MDFFKLKKFRNARKPVSQDLAGDQPVPQPDEPKSGPRDTLSKSVTIDSTNTEMEDDDDDFITNEVKRRLKELRRNSFMVLIPEETNQGDEEDDEEEEGETSSNEWRDVEAEGRQFWSGFDAVYDIYCERMLFFDRLSSHQLLEIGSHILSTPSPRSASKKLPSPLRCLSLKKLELPKEEVEQLQQPVTDPYQDLETAYVAQVCLTWEALNCQYTQLCQKMSYQPETPTSYNHSAQQFQQFHVLLQRFIENEPFEAGPRSEIYARARKTLPNLLQVPKIQGRAMRPALQKQVQVPTRNTLTSLLIYGPVNFKASDEKNAKDDTSDMVRALDLARVIETSILSFRHFIKKDKRKGGSRNLFGSQNLMTTPAQLVQASLEKKSMKLKELWKKTKSYKKKTWPNTTQDVEMLLGLVDVKILLRVLRMSRISKEQLFWCEEKMKKLVLSDGKLQRDPSPVLFPLVVGHS